MKKYVISVLSLLLSLVMLSSCSCIPLDLLPIGGGEEDDQQQPSWQQSQQQSQDQSQEQDKNSDEHEQPENTEDTNQPQGALLNGVNISEYAIIYSSTDPDYTKRAAEYIQAQIKERTGVKLFLRSDSTKQSGREIVVGETSRDISKELDANTQYTQFAILADDDQIALEGDYFVIAAAAYFFIETYISGPAFDSKVPMKTCIHEPIVKKAENYIFLIGDGMGIYQTQLFDSFGNTATFDDGETMFYGYMLGSQGLCRTNSLSGTTDSAAAGTALATGYKTINRYVGKDKNLKVIQSLTELAGMLGMSTAVMSTESATGATPSSFSGHASDRDDSSTISASQAETSALYGTIIDCNYDYYTATQINNNIESRIRSNLATLSQNENGFFLMYEEAYIDKHCHNNDAYSAYLAVVRFNQAIGVFMEYAFYNPNTFVIITADHETGALLPNSSGGFSFGSTNHSSHYVPVFAYGDGAELFSGATIENVQIPKTIASFWGVYNFGDQTDGYEYLK